MALLTSTASNVVLASLLAAAAWLVQRRLARPGVARVLWVLVLVKLVTPPLVSMPLIELPGTMACALGACGCDRHAPTTTFVRETLPWTLLGVWLAGAVAALFAACHRWMRFQRLLEHAHPAPPSWQSLASRLASQLSLRRPPEILAVPGRLPPLVVPSLGRPRLLLPLELLGQLNRSQQSVLLLHELVHIKRGDHWVRVLELVIRIAFWWLPALGSIGRQLRTCEETCCDAAVVACLPRARRDYAKLLLDVLDFTDPLPRHVAPQATAMSAADNFEQRLSAILGDAQAARRVWPTRALAAALACATLPWGLHYDFVRDESAGRPALAASSEVCEPTTKAASWPSVDRSERLPAFCCPS